jgi:hypothetical protein
MESHTLLLPLLDVTDLLAQYMQRRFSAKIKSAYGNREARMGRACPSSILSFEDSYECERITDMCQEYVFGV